MPVYVRTGKRLPRRITEVAIQFQRPPQLPLFPHSAAMLEPDALIVQVQPDERLSLRFGAKVPGLAFEVRKASMEFSYGAGFEDQYPEAYERVILDALRGDPTLFIRADEVARSWRIVDPILQCWAADEEPIPLYQAATWGPRAADRPDRPRGPGLARPLVPGRRRLRLLRRPLLRHALVLQRLVLRVVLGVGAAGIAAELRRTRRATATGRRCG